MGRPMARGLAALLLSLVCLAAQAQPRLPEPAPEISLITFGPGEIYWQRFGHNAILVREPGGGEPTLYNYGVFDFEQDHFLLNFVRGRMMYRIAEEPFGRAMRPYAIEGRWAVEQRLALSAGQARELHNYLRWNLRPENVEYRYDYFVANCSTRLRDALDNVLDGAIRRQFQAIPAGTTYRSQVSRLMRAEPALLLGVDLALGPAADRALSEWQAAFIPMRFMEALRGVVVDDGLGEPRQLVAEERRLLPPPAAAEPARAPRLALPFAAAGLGYAALLFGLSLLRGRRPARAAFATLAFGYSLLSAVAGLVLLALWLLTEHWPTRDNFNLLLLNPLGLLLLPAWFGAGFSGWQPSRRACLLALLIAAAAVAAGVLAATPWAPQQQLHWGLLLMPGHVALAVCVWRRRRQLS